jgi:tetratricopeptide (TPR) repeat protein
MKGLIKIHVLALLLVTDFLLQPANAQQATTLAGPKTQFERGNYRDAKTSLMTVPDKSPDYPEAQYYLGRIAVEEKAYEESIQRFENAVHSRSGIAEYHNWLGVMYGLMAMHANPLRQAYLAPKIREEFEKAAALDPGNLQTQWGLLTYYVQAPGFLGGSWEKAFACANIISRHSIAGGCRARGVIYSAQKKTDQAEREFLEATRRDPHDAENAYALAQFYFDQRRTERSFTVYDLVLADDPENMVAAFRLGTLSARCGLHLDEGIRCLTRYLAYTPRPNEPSHSGASFYLALIYEKKGDRLHARSYYQASLRLEPGMKEAKEGLARLN